MMYAGGKARIAKRLVDIVLARESTVNWFWEPFAGGGNSLVEFVSRLPENTPCFASDSNVDIVAMYDAYAKNWRPPSSISHEEYRAIKKLPSPNPLRGFAGTTCSFSGKWFCGYASNKIGRDYTGAGIRWLRKHESTLARVSFRAGSYDRDQFDLPDTPGLIYCDPPYVGTEQRYKYVGTEQRYKYGSFDSNKFWEWVRWRVESNGDKVYVSEYTAPSHFVEVAAFNRQTSMRFTGKSIDATDRLFVHRSQA